MQDHNEALSENLAMASNYFPTNAPWQVSQIIIFQQYVHLWV